MTKAETIKSVLKIIILIGVSISISIVSSCDLFQSGITISSRVDSFNSDLKAGNYDKLYKHFHPDTLEKEDMQTQDYDWGPLSYSGTYIKNYNVSGDTVTGVIDNTNTELDFTMQMKKDGINNYILSLTIGSSYEIRKID